MSLNINNIFLDFWILHLWLLSQCLVNSYFSSPVNYLFTQIAWKKEKINENRHDARYFKLHIALHVNIAASD